MEAQSRHGITYLIDYYALLGTERAADIKAIRAAYHKQMLLYHEDRYAHLAEEARHMAVQRTRVLNEAWAVLKDLATRKEYDEKLAAWKGPLSTDGVPIVDPTREYFSVSVLMGDARHDEIDRMIQDALQKTAQFDLITFGIIEALFREGNSPSPEIRHAYQEQLEKRARYFEICEIIAWKELGMIHAPTATHLSLAHAEKTADKIAMVRNGLKQEVEKVVRMIAAGEMRALGAGGKDESALAIADPRAAIERYYAAAFVEFNARADKVRDAAKSIAETVDKQLDAMAWGYVPEQTEFFPRL
ncbi:MAG: J domain-containing protein, partial [Patescibacteria group bacterium]